MHSYIALLMSALCAGSLFLAAFLFLTGFIRVNRLANQWLGLFFFLLSLVFVQLLLQQTSSDSQLLLIRITEWSRWAIFPCLYMAICAFVCLNKRVHLTLLHFFPVAAFVFISFISGRSLPPAAGIIVRYFFFAQGIVYGALNLKILINHKRNIRKLLADTDSDLNWLRNFVYAPLLIALIWLAFRHFPQMDGILYLLCLALALYFISAALQQRAVYPAEIANVGLIAGEPKTASTSQRLTPQQIALLKERVTSVIEQKKPYLDPLLNLQTLADEVGINTHELSLVLNQGFGVNFYAYINGLRTQEAVKLLASGKYGRGDMEAVAFRSGFNSRTTFYAAIRKLKQVTPTSLLK